MSTEGGFSKAAPLLRLGNKIVRGDSHRRSRLHTERGVRVAVKPADVAFALGTTAGRRLGYYPTRPLWAADARRYLEGYVDGARVFEWGSGMSTVWLARRAREVVSVEDDPAWFKRLSVPLARYPHVSVVFADSQAEYVSALAQPFDVVIVDGSWRAQCIRRAADWIRPGATIVIDDTDKGDEYSELENIAGCCFPEADCQRFSGYAHGCLVPHETTVFRIEGDEL